MVTPTINIAIPLLFFFLMQLEIRVKISKRSSAKRQSTEVTFWFKMASNLRLVGREAKFFHFSCKFLPIGLFGFRKGKKVNPQKFEVQQLIIPMDRERPLLSHTRRNFWIVWPIPVYVFQPISSTCKVKLRCSIAMATFRTMPKWRPGSKILQMSPMILIADQMVYSWNKKMILLEFCPKTNNFA